MSGIAVVLPTRGRHLNLDRFISSMVMTAAHRDPITFYLYIDEDDKQTIDYIPLSHYKSRIVALVGPRIRMSETVNKLLPYIKEDIFFCGADDLIMRTPCWDTIVCDWFNNSVDKIWLAFGYDGYHDNFATHPILHRNWVETLGFITPPYFESDYADTWLDEIATKLGRKIKLPFTNEHMHYTFGKSNMDQTYYDCRVRFSQTNPIKVYQDLSDKRNEDTEKLRCKILV